MGMSVAERAGEARPHRNRARQLWVDIHLWLGLVLGFWLALIGLTGSILVFFYELEEVIHPQLFTVVAHAEGEAAYRPLSEVLSAAQAVMPPHSTMGFAYYPRTNAGAYWLFYEVPAHDAAPGKVEHWQVFVNPYTAEVLGKWQVMAHDGLFPQEFFMFVFSLHDALLLPWEVGGIVVGIIAVLATVSVFAGLYLWWPKTGKWYRSLTFKRGASGKRFVYELHNLSGVYLLPVLLSVLLSGIFFNLPDQFFWVVRQFSPDTKNRYEVKSAPLANNALPIGLGAAFQIARQRYPEGRPDWLYNANHQDAAYTICAGGVKSVSRFADRRCVVIDQYTGKVLQVSASGAETGGNTFVAWQWPLHSGQAFGLAGRILVLFSGLALPVLFVTGVMRWLHKRRSATFVAQRRLRLAGRI